MIRYHLGQFESTATGDGVLSNVAVWLLALLGGLPIVALHARAAEAPAKKPSVQAVSAQTVKTSSPFRGAVREEVVARLNEIKPKDTKEHVYRVNVVDSIEQLSGNLRLDLVYKKGHYRWSLVALRFERREGCDEVDVSEVTHGSSFGFLKDFMRSAEESSTGANHTGQSDETNTADDVLDYRDFARVRRGTIPVEAFDRLVLRGLALWRSSISEVYVGLPRESFGGSSSMHSSGDGLILFRLAESTGNGHRVHKDDGTLIAGDLTPRIKGSPWNYKDVRTHLFWEGFHNYLREHPLPHDVPAEEAASLLVECLKEPRLAKGYRDYFRRSLYVTVLGELGRAEAIPALREAARAPQLASWNKHLRRDIATAIAKIKVLSARDPTANLIRLLTDSGDSPGRWAVERIERLPEDRRSATLLSAAEQQGLTPHVLRWILRGLAGVKRDDVRQLMSRHLVDADAETRLLAAGILWRTWSDPAAAQSLDAIFRGQGLETARYPEDLQVEALEVLRDPVHPAADIEQLLPAFRAELQKSEEYWRKHPYVIDCILDSAILWNQRDLLPAVERMARFESGNARAHAIDTLIRLAPDKAREIVRTMDVSDSLTLKLRRPLYAALLKIDELIEPLEAEQRGAQKDLSEEESAARIERIDLALPALRAGTASDHTRAVLALLREYYDYVIWQYLSIAHLRAKYSGDAQVQAVIDEYLDHPDRHKLNSWLQAADKR